MLVKLKVVKSTIVSPKVMILKFGRNIVMGSID